MSSPTGSDSSLDPGHVTDTSWHTRLGHAGFVGAGAVATTLARALASLGVEVVAVAARTSASALALAQQLPAAKAVATPAEVATRAQTVFLAVPDDAIASVAERIPWQRGQVVIHLSGAKDLTPLDTAASAGASVAALHPLMTFPKSIRTWPVPRLLEYLTGCTWTLQSNDPPLADALSGMVHALGGRTIALPPGQRVPYHLAAVMASNFVVALVGAAVELWQGFGIAPEEALAALLPLTRATVESLQDVGVPDALTGPIARGDTGTVATHLAWLSAAVGENPQFAVVTDAYRALARLAIPLALAKGTLSSEGAAELERLLDTPRAGE